jgi:hypothetical protein
LLDLARRHELAAAAEERIAGVFVIVAQPAQQQPMPGAAAAVTREARDLGLMHRIDHGGGGAGAAEHVADIEHVADASSFAAELTWNRNPHEALGARRGHRLGRETRVAIDGDSMFRGDRGDLFRAGGEARGAGCDAASTLPRTTALAPGTPCKAAVRRWIDAFTMASSITRLRRYPLPQQVLQNFRFIATFSANYRASFA